MQKMKRKKMMESEEVVESIVCQRSVGDIGGGDLSDDHHDDQIGDHEAVSYTHLTLPTN